MKTFALITEGITDQAILENILDGLTGGQALTKCLRPLRDETDKKRVAENEFSNWELVLEYIKSDEILNAIQTSDFVVIHIDTDECEHPNFGISLLENGTIKTIDKIASDCIKRIKDFLHPGFPQNEIGRLIFAIPVLSSECWLVGLHNADHNHTNKTINNCEDRLIPLLKNIKVRYAKEYRIYSKISAGFRKKKKLIATAKKSPCLQNFARQIDPLFNPD